jgi:hypothetical protein
MKCNPFSIAVAALVWTFFDGVSLSLAEDTHHTKDTKPRGAHKAQVSEQKPQPAKRKRKQKRTQKPPPRSTQSMLADKPKTQSAEPQPTAARAVDDDADVRTEGDTSVKTMEFTGLDIEGQLKTPQMLFFLNRMRAEFDRPRLPHRSFMPELGASREDKGL